MTENVHRRSTCFINNILLNRLMPPVPHGIFHFGPPIEELLIEFAYFLLVMGISGYVYLKTKEIYELTKHKGIYHFRNIFLYFGLAYLFRLSLIAIMFSGELLGYEPPRFFPPISFILVSYFSTMAIFSVLFSITEKNFSINETLLNVFMNITAITLAIVMGFTRSNFLLMLIQTLVFFIAIMIAVSKKEKGTRLLTQNRMTFIMLFVFWVVNSLAFVRRFLPIEIKIILYLVSGFVFLSIFLRVKKRLINAEKKRSP
jgi:hypothetical protein